MAEERSAESDALTVPDCPACGKPLGLYYAECLVCYAAAAKEEA